MVRVRTMKRKLIFGILTVILVALLAMGAASAGTYQTVDEAVTGIIGEMRTAGITGEYNQALWLHDWLTGHANYDESNYWFDPEGVLLHGTGVCQSYTDAYALLLTAAGIENDTMGSESMDHSWNVVKLDGEWCYIDVTWDDPTGGGKENHFYFGMNEALFSRDHTLVNPPYECTTLDNYYPLRNNEGVLLASNKEEMIQELNRVIPTRPTVIRLNYYGTDPTFSVVGAFVEWAESVNYRYGILGFNADYHNFLATFTMEYTDPWEKPATVLEQPVTIDPFTMDGPAGTYRLSNYAGNGVVLVFGREDCFNTRSFLKGFRPEAEGLASVGVETLVSVIEANGVEDILAMEDALAGDGVDTGYNLLYDQSGLMRNYLHAVGFDTTTGVSFPCVFLINASGQIVSYSTGFVSNMTETIASAYALGTGKPLPKPEQTNPHEIENGSGNVSQLSGHSQISAIKSAVASGKYVVFLCNQAINYNSTQSFLQSWENKHGLYEALGIDLIVALKEMTADLQNTYPHVQFVNYSDNDSDFWTLLQNAGFDGTSASSLCNFFYAPDGHCIAYSNGSTLNLNSCALLTVADANFDMIIPEDLVEIGDGAFAGSSFRNADLTMAPLTRIGAGAFAGCTGLHLVSIPASVMHIGDGAFSGCENAILICPATSEACKYAIQNNILYLNR